MKTFVTFTHEGMNIHNPFASPCSRFPVEPEYYGFKVIGSKAPRRMWRKVTNTGWIVCIDEARDGNHKITGYRPDGTMWHSNTIAEANEAAMRGESL